MLNSEFKILNCAERKANAEPRHRRSFRIQNSEFSIAALAICLLVAACETTRVEPDPKKDEPEIKPDQEIITGELQSDFLELGAAAGVEWLSFYPDDYMEYPELFDGMDRDQRRRLRLAPREGANKVLLKFDLPKGAKIWPVDWYGTECVAIDLPDAMGFTVALADVNSNPAMMVADQRKLRLKKPTAYAEYGGKTIMKGKHPAVTEGCYRVGPEKGVVSAIYGDGLVGSYLAVIEARFPTDAPLSDKHYSGCLDILHGMSVVRQLALEGSPKHKCTSSIDELKQGIVNYEKGGLKLALPEGWTVHKTGNSSTVQIDGACAKPLALIRKLKKSEGSLRQVVDADTVFSRRRDRADAFFSKGRALRSEEPYIVVFDYKDHGIEQVVLGVIATGNETLTFELVSTGVRDGAERRKIKDAALDMLSTAEVTTVVRNSVPNLSELVDWKPRER